MLTTGLKLITGYNELKKQALQNSPDFSNNLCEFLAAEFELQSVLLLKQLPENKLTVIGRSQLVKKAFKENVEISCQNCPNLINSKSKLTFLSGDGCGITSTDFLLYEGCISFDVADSTYLLKLSQKSQFLPIDTENVSAIVVFVKDLIELWGGGNLNSEISFSKLISAISGELKTPANSILGFASLLSSAENGTTQAEYTLAIKDNSLKLLNLLNDLIEIAKLDNGSVEETLGSIKVQPFIEELIKSFQDKLTGYYYSFEMIVEQGVPESIKIDPNKLKAIFSSIVSFLISSTQNGNISISAGFTGRDEVVFTIAEPNLSIPLTELKELFRVINYKPEESNKALSSSVLCLNLANRLTRLINGELEVVSIPGKGTSFTVKLKTQALNPLEASIGALPKIEGTKNKVLVIEDDYATAKLLSNYLNKWGYEPSIINSGLRALQLLEKEVYLAIITDVTLPDINGLELLKKIRENKSTKHTPIIVCSVEAEQQKAFMMGAVEYFIKPISYRDLVEVLTSYKLKKDSNVLCVDDDPATLNLVKEAIESVGFNPIAEIKSSRVMNRIEGVELDLAIVDLDMPDVNGFELIKLIKSEQRFAGLPIIIYTGKENFDEDLAKIDGLFSELLSKRSTKIEDLAETINKMVNRYEEPTPIEEVAKATDVTKVLLVEDYKHSQIIVTRLLKKNGFTSVVVVENGAEALEQVKQQHFDLILMDMQMPVMNGFEATERIRQIPEYKDTPIIALTAFAMKGDREKCLDAGATDYIPKPIDSYEFIEKVKYYTSI